MKIGLRLAHLTERETSFTFFCLLLLGLMTYCILPVSVFVPGGYSEKTAAGIMAALVFAAVYYQLLKPVFLWDSGMPASERSVMAVFSWSFISFFSVCLVYLLAYYPGGMTTDSFVQWRQMERFRFDDWHPAFSTLFNWLITRVGHSPAAIALTDSLLFSLVFASMMAYLKKLGLDRRILITVAAVFVMNPVNGIMAVTIWKDIPYSVSLLWLTLLAMKILYSRGGWMEIRRNRIVLSGSLVFAALIRHNGIVPVILMMAALFILYRRQRRNAALVALSVLSVIAIIRGPVYRVLEVAPGCAYQSMVNPIMQVGGIISGGGTLTEEERRVVTNILPLEKWKEGYSIYSEVPLASVSGFNMDYFRTNRMDFLRAWAGMALRNPGLAIKAYLYRTAIIWRIISPPGNRVYTNYGIVEPNSMGFVTESKIPAVKGVLDYLLWKANDGMFLWIAWKPATYLLLILLFGMVGLVKNGIRWMLVLIPVIGNTLGLLLVTTSDQSRYYYATMIAAPFIIAAAFLKDRRLECGKGKGTERPGDSGMTQQK